MPSSKESETMSSLNARVDVRPRNAYAATARNRTGSPQMRSHDRSIRLEIFLSGQSICFRYRLPISATRLEVSITKLRKHKTDLLRGTLDLLILRTLEPQPLHGIAVADRIRQA